ncbi:PEP-CTERM sorting domain-containing protein [Duganella callida]|nr:PEP-CTERM sorting domain-containing protein [Duganella callida]
MKTMRKLKSIALALGLASLSTAAFADASNTFNLKDGGGNTYVSGATSLDWNAQGSGVAIGVGPFSDNSLLPVGASFQFLYQANLVTVGGGVANSSFTNLDATSNGGKDAGKTFEFTIVASFTETVTASNFVGSNPSAVFGLGGSTATNKVAIYYDSKANANTGDGTGFDDGKLVAMFSIVPDGTDSSFMGLNGRGTGLGSTHLHAELVESGDFVDAAYLEGIQDLIFGLDFQSNLNYPAGTSDTSAFHASAADSGPDLFGTYNVDHSRDIVFKVDGDSTTTRLPEPGSTLLVGLGLLGIAGVTRRRKSKG